MKYQYLDVLNHKTLSKSLGSSGVAIDGARGVALHSLPDFGVWGQRLIFLSIMWRLNLKNKKKIRVL